MTEVGGELKPVSAMEGVPPPAWYAPFGVPPTIGRVVHYRNAAGEVMPAIVTRVRDGGVLNLCVMPDGSAPTPVLRAQFLEALHVAGAGWFWPPRV